MLKQEQASQGPRGYTANYEHTNASTYQNLYNSAPAQVDQYRSYTAAKAYESKTERPSPFPKLKDAGPNVPPSDDEKEQVLERARSLVLNSNDPEMQLAWAQDALLWVETVVALRERLAGDQAQRPPTPNIEHQLRVDAISIISFLAEQTHPKALFLKATWYEFGKFGYALDRKEAFQAYRRAAEKGYARAEYRIGTQYEGMQDMGKAIKHYTIGTSLGDSASNYRLGMMTLLGQHGQRQDWRLGIEQIKFAADTADENAPQGAYVYGMLLARELPNINIPDQFLPVDIEQAKLFIEKAAYLGFAKAQQKMGQAYELCLLGCDFNPALSLHYNALAARQGEPEADMAISKWFLCGFEGIFDKNEELAFTYAQRAADGGLATAEFAMGYFYEIGMYVKTDLQQAEDWYRKAANNGNKDAVGRLQSISQKQTLNKDHEQIAITRIRSQYGSKKGNRPDRFKEKPIPLAPMSEERVDMPDHSRHSQVPQGGRLSISGDVYNLPRPKSTAPYPEDDVVSGGYGGRPLSGPINPQLRPMAGPPADRPMSAFGIRPLNVNPNQDDGFRQPIRPASSMSNMSAVPQGRGTDPMNRHRVVSAGWEPQARPQSDYRQISPNRGPPPTQHQPYDNSQAGRNKLSKPGPNNYQTQPSLPQQPTQPAGRAPQDPSRGQRQPPPATQTRHEGLPSRPNIHVQSPSPHQQTDSRASLPSNGGPRQERFDQTPQNQSRMSQRPAPQTADSTQSLPARLGSAAPSNHSTQSVPARPIKQGPKSFEEMGIPVAKTEGDCVSSQLCIYYRNLANRTTVCHVNFADLMK
jgi:TPR repeat protein